MIDLIKTDAPPVKARICCCGATDVGMKRSRNEDQYLIADLHKNMHVCDSSIIDESSELYGETMGKLMLVADGIGGAQAGDIASRLAIREISRYFLNSIHWPFRSDQLDIERFIKDLKAGAHRTHQAICRDSKQNPDHHGMGCTLTVAYLVWPMLYVLHVGDSRCYVLRDGFIQCLTKDQTLAQMLYDSGRLNRSEFEKSPYHNILVSAIGGANNPEAIVYKTQLIAGDRILLCSDGVNRHLSDKQIGSVLAKTTNNAETICQQLIEQANAGGGQDNITVVVATTEKER